MIALHPAQIDADQALELEVGRFAAEVPEQDIFGGNGRVRLEFEAPVAVLALRGQQRLRGARNVTLEGLGRRQVLGMMKSYVHEQALTRPSAGAAAPARE